MRSAASRPECNLPLCGCLCDDLVVRVEGGIVTSVDNACALGSEKFLSRSRLNFPISRSGGSWAPIGFPEAIRYAAEVLADAERPLLFGWSGTSAEAQCTGIHIAEEVRGVIDNCSSICHGPSLMGIQEAGHPGCSLGVVKNRADVVIYWGSNPIESHPRHLSRYTTFVNGRYQDNGHLDRTLVVVDIRKTDTAKIADEFIRIKPGGDYALSACGDPQGADILPEIAGIPRERLIWLADLCRNARFGALFTGIGLTQSPGRYKNVRNAIELVDELNRHTKFTLTPMRGHWNVNGTNQTFSYLTGYPYGVDFARGPYYNRARPRWSTCLAGEADARLIIGADPGAHLSRCNEHLATIPRSSSILRLAVPPLQMSISRLRAWGSTRRTGYRMDSIPIRLRRVLDSDLQPMRRCCADTASHTGGRGPAPQNMRYRNAGEMMPRALL